MATGSVGPSSSSNKLDLVLRFGACGVGLVAFGGLLGGDVVNGTLRDGFVGQTIAWYLLAFVAFGLAMASVERSSRFGDSKVPGTWFWLLPILFRVLLWFTEPTLSDDVYRYLWDGHLISNGVSPYLHPVGAPELDAYDIGFRSMVNNPDLSTPYLPAAEALFGLVRLFVPGGGATAVQVVMTAFDLATAAIIVKLLVRCGLPVHRVGFYLWNPLVIVEVAHGAHIDAFMTALLMGAMLASTGSASRRIGSPLLLAAATLTRGLPVLAVAVLWWRWSWTKRLVFAAACVIPVIGFAITAGFGFGADDLASGTGVFGAARAYGERWVFNGSLFNGVLTLLDGPQAASRARLIVAVAMILVGAVTTLAARRRHLGRPSDDSPDRDSAVLRADLRAVAMLLAAYVLLTPTLNPWYLVSLMALLPFWPPTEHEHRRRWLFLAPWLYLAAAVSFSYLTYLDPLAHAELPWVRKLEWWPTLLLLVVSVALDRRPSTSIDANGHVAARPSTVPGQEPG